MLWIWLRSGDVFSPLWILHMLSASATAVYTLTLLPQKSAVVTELHERLTNVLVAMWVIMVSKVRSKS